MWKLPKSNNVGYVKRGQCLPPLPKNPMSGLLYSTCQPIKVSSEWNAGKYAILQGEMEFKNSGKQVLLSPRTTDAQWSLFSLKSRTFGLGQTNWAVKFWGNWGIFGRTISPHFGVVSPLSMCSIVQPLSLKNLSLYICIPNIHLGLGFEFGPKRIRDLAFVCP